MVTALANHPVWQVRMYAASAAGVLADTAALARLARDGSDNVRDAAINALVALVRPEPGGSAARVARTAWVDSIFTAQLARKDYQLVLDAARALEGAAPSHALTDALYAALAQLTTDRSETSRDPRLELIARIEVAGSASESRRLERYVTDFDPAVAARVADVLRAWGAPGVAPRPQPLAATAVSLRELAALRDARVRVTMAPQSGGGSFDLQLFPDDAPATIARFVSLARRGYYNGLTFHRVATNFVIQGGSPGANEYVGHDRYMRDELGLRSHARGTLGISTRGRDTGDAQIFVNLIDNFRLDHDYTVFAEVVRGLDVVDRVLEGDVIARVEVIRASERSR
jgi:cyclophilin family peptidyl-prolyl cis-trans isomerase